MVMVVLKLSKRQCNEINDNYLGEEVLRYVVLVRECVG